MAMNTTQNTTKREITAFLIIFLIIVIISGVAAIIIIATDDKNESSGNEKTTNTTNATNQKNQESDDLMQTIRNLQKDVSSTYKQYVYDNIKSGMYYSDVEKMMESVTKQLRSALPELSMQMDTSNGMYFPKWIISVTASGRVYPLIALEIELNTSYMVVHKSMGDYKY